MSETRKVMHLYTRGSLDIMRWCDMARWSLGGWPRFAGPWFPIDQRNDIDTTPVPMVTCLACICTSHEHRDAYLGWNHWTVAPWRRHA